MNSERNRKRPIGVKKVKKLFDFFCYSHKQNFNRIASEIEIGVQEERKPAAGEIFFDLFC